MNLLCYPMAIEKISKNVLTYIIYYVILILSKDSNP